MFNQEFIQWAGRLFAAAIMDVIVEKKLPQLQLSTGKGTPNVRFIMLDDTPVTMTKEEIQQKISQLKAVPGKDVGFSYVSEGLRIIVVPEAMSMQPVIGTPLGTPQG